MRAKARRLAWHRARVERLKRKNNESMLREMGYDPGMYKPFRVSVFGRIV